MRIAFMTLGCKINQFETDVMRQEFQSRGNTIVPFDAAADVYIINTCSVTAKSDYQSRQEIRSALRRGNGARVVITGCYAETQPGEIRKIPGAQLIFGNRDKSLIVDHIMSTTGPAPQGMLSEADLPLKNVQSRTRGILKIQDGCDNRCSYCIVPLARGGSQSASPRDVLRELERLVEAGCPEVVLTGIHIGTYGSDLGSGITLTKMVKTLLSARGRTRIRLSSIEPREITEEMLGFLGKGLCRHLHIPLQSGDDTILASMKRNYTSVFYQDLLENISKQVPDIALGADIMVGFPGEGEKEFNNTLQLVEASPITHLHVFSFSPRPGTPAAEMKNQVPEQVKKERNEILRNLGKRKNFDFRNKCVGTELSAVMENKVDANTGCFSGLTDNYIKLQVSGSKSEHIGKEIKVLFKSFNNEYNFADIL